LRFLTAIPNGSMLGHWSLLIAELYRRAIRSQRRGPTMPIVFVLFSDPVAQGFVSNMAHLGGNITGFSYFEFSIGGKWIELLKQISPGLAHVALVSNPDTSPSRSSSSARLRAPHPRSGWRRLLRPFTLARTSNG
jgi:ABC-type uncharacterized transport system substrate-binding protein